MRIIWFRLRTENNKRICLPISCNVFRELLDSIHDVLTFLCIFAPKSHIAPKAFTRLFMEFFGSISEDGPYDLIDVTADKVQFSIKVM